MCMALWNPHPDSVWAKNNITLKIVDDDMQQIEGECVTFERSTYMLNFDTQNFIFGGSHNRPRERGGVERNTTDVVRRGRSEKTLRSKFSLSTHLLPPSPAHTYAHTEDYGKIFNGEGCKFRAKREITLIARGMKLTRPCSHAPVATLLPARVGQTAR